MLLKMELTPQVAKVNSVAKSMWTPLSPLSLGLFFMFWI